MVIVRPLVVVVVVYIAVPWFTVKLSFQLKPARRQAGTDHVQRINLLSRAGDKSYHIDINISLLTVFGRGEEVGMIIGCISGIGDNASLKR